MPILKKYNAHPKWMQKEESSYKSGSRHKVFFLNGSTHVGLWNKDVKEGKGATLSKRKYLYEGDFVDGKRHGYGVLSVQQPDGSFRLMYRGHWKNGQKDKSKIGNQAYTAVRKAADYLYWSHAGVGYLILVWFQGHGMQRSGEGSCYEGEWSLGQRCGNGKAWFTDGSFYQGTWKNNRVHGAGVLIFPNGNWFEGEFNNGYRHGTGKYFHFESEQIQEGVWSCGICVSSTVMDASDKRKHRIPPNNLQNLDEFVNKQFNVALTSICSSGTNLSLFPATNPTFL